MRRGKKKKIVGGGSHVEERGGGGSNVEGRGGGGSHVEGRGGGVRAGGRSPKKLWGHRHRVRHVGKLKMRRVSVWGASARRAAFTPGHAHLSLTALPHPFTSFSLTSSHRSFVPSTTSLLEVPLTSVLIHLLGTPPLLAISI